MKRILLLATALMLAVSSIFAQCDAPTNVTAHAQWNKVKLTWESSLSQTPTFDGTVTYQPNVVASGIGYDAAGIFSAVVRFPADSLTAHSGMYLTHVGFVPYALTLNRVTVRIRQGGSYVGGTFNPGNVVSTTTVPVDDLQAGVANTIRLTTPVLVDATQELWIECEIEATSGFPGAVGNVAHPTYNDLIYDATDGWDYLDNLDLTNYGWLIEGYFEASPSPIVGFSVLRDNVQLNTSIINGNSFVDNTVQTEQQYCYTVQTWCDTDGVNTASADPVCVTTPEEPNCSGIIGNGTGSTYYIPVNPFYNYSYSQQIFSASEISSTPGTIVSAAFQYFYASPLAANHIEVYMANTNQSTFASGNSWIPGSSLTQVYSGPLTFNNTGDSSLVNIDFDNAFEWDGHSNVVLAVKYDQGSYDNSDPRFYTHSTTGAKSIYINQDGSPYDINNPGSGTTMASRNNVKFCLGPAPSCLRPSNLQVNNLTAESADISWQAGYETDSQWEIVIVPTGTPVSDGIAESVYDTNYSALNLDANTGYDVYVRTVCGGGDYSEWAEFSFRTNCVPVSTVPYMEDFSGYGTAAGAFPYCWTRETNNTTAYPYITSNYQLYFYSYNLYYSRAITQGFDLTEETPGTLALSFLIGKASDTYGRMDVGYVTDPSDMNTYHPLKSYFPGDYQTTGFFQQEIIELPASVYNQTVYFVFEAPAPISYTTNYVNMKNVAVDYLPQCSTPSRLTVDNITGTAASLSWDAAPFGADDYTVEYAESGTQNFTPIIVSGTNVDIMGLTNGTSYDVLLYSNCQEGESDTLTTTFSTVGCFAISSDTSLMTNDTIGNGTGTSTNLPSYSFYNYGYSQQIYKASEIQGAGYISAISLNASTIAQQRIYDIYMMHTDVESSASWLPADNAQLVYTGSLNLTTGWNTFNFTNPFYYNGTNNLVLIMIDKTGTYVSGNSWLVHNGGSNCSRYAYQDGSQYDTHSTPSGSVSSTSDRNNIILTFAACDDNFTCVAPVVTVTDYDDENITVSWLPGNAETSWEVEYKLATDNNWNSEGVVNATTHTFTGLTPGESYNIRVRSNCSSNEQSDWSTVNAHTICTPIATLPFSEDFENVTDYPECWNRIYNSSSVTPTISTSYNYTSNGSKSLYFETPNSSNYTYAVLPRFDNAVAMNNLLVQFAGYKYSEEYFIQVGIMSDPEDINTFEAITTFSPGTVGAWESTEVTTSNYHGNGHYLAFRIPAWIYNCFYLDDIYVEEIPDCMHVSNIHAVNSSITPYSLDVTWTPGGEESAWEVVYGLAGTITDPSVESSTTEFTNTISLTNLNANTLYEVFVKALCGGNEESNWFSGTVRTGCAAITQLPYEENLDSYPGATDSYNVTNNLPQCWDYSSACIFTPYTEYPIVYNNSSYAASGSNSLYFYTYSSSDYGDQIVMLPEIDTQTYPLNTLQVEFAARCSYNNSYTTFQVIVGAMSGTDVNTFVPIDTISNESAVYEDYEVSLVGYTGAGNRIAFKITPPNDGGMTDYNEGYIDNILIGEQPTCPRPSEIHMVSTSSGTVVLGWTTMGQEAAWNIEYGPTGFTHGNGTVEVATTNPFTITNLADTIYDFYVQADCGGEQSLWRGPLTVRPNTYTMPTVGSDTLTMCGGHIYDDGGLTGNYSSYCDATVVLNPEPGMVVQVQGTLDAESCCDHLYIYDGVGTNGTLLWSDETSTTAGVPLVESSVGALTIYFHSDVSIQYSGFDLAVSCVPAPTCPKPTNFEATATTTSSITLAWDENGTATQWNIEYGPAGFTQGSGTTITATSNPYEVTGLNASTNYSFYVQADCGGGDVSYWSDVLNVATSCDLMTLPYTENFDSYSGTNYSTPGPIPTCWTTNTTNTSYPAPHVTGSGSYWYPHSGTNCLVFTCGSAGADAYAVLPEFGQPLNTLHLNFYRQMESTSSGTLYVGYVTSSTNMSTFVSVATIPSLSGTGDTISVDFTGANIPANGNIAFHWNHSSSYYSCCIDDINVTVAGTPGPGTTCDAPTNVNASGVSQTSATITWTPGGDETAWNLQYKATTSSNWSNNISVSNNASYMLTGLTANTAYQVRVQAVCDANSVSDWANGSFTTLNEDTPTCPAPTNVTANNITTNSAVITWNQEPNTATSWTVLYKQAVASTWETATANATTYSLTGLNADTQYDVQVMANCDNGVQSAASETIHFTTQADGVNDYVLDAAISVYPNPTNGQFTIDNEQFIMNNVAVYDVYGKLLMNVEVNDYAVTIDATSFSAGVYFARIFTDNGVVTKRIVKK